MMRTLFLFGASAVVLGCSNGDSNGLKAGAGGGGGSASTASGKSSASGNPTSTGSSGVPGNAPVISGCTIFPDDSPWNEDISGASLHPKSDAYISNMNPGQGMHPDWGKMTDEYGIPFMVGTGATPEPMHWTVSWGFTESDKDPCPGGGGNFCYPIPLTAPIEGGPGASKGSDRHVLYLDTAGAPSNCTLYELYQAQNPGTTGGWTAANGAIFPLGTNKLRPDGWTSADAAGLPILPGLVRLDEVMAGEIRHAIRFTMDASYNAYIHPATHAAGDSDSTDPPMGLHLRLKASFDTSSFSGPSLIVVKAMQKYGIILADNGSDWYISGESNNGWAPYMDNLVGSLSNVTGGDFEVIDTGPSSMNNL